MIHFREHDISRLDIPVHNVVTMKVRDGFKKSLEYLEILLGLWLRIIEMRVLKTYQTNQKGFPLKGVHRLGKNSFHTFTLR